jgi:hypothetical protein
MIRLLGILASLLICCNITSGQVDTNFVYVKPSKGHKSGDTPKHLNNSYYFELLGSTYGLGVSYELRLANTPNVMLNARIGIGSLFLINAAPTIGLNALFGKEKSFLEIGFNAVRSYDIEFFNDNWNINWLANPVLGYRIITTKGVIFRVTLTPFFNNINQGYGINFIPYGGLSLGKLF